MSTALTSQQELYDLFINELQSQAPELTDTHEGSIIDVVGGTTSIVAEEIGKLIVDKFKKTFFATADGPEITGGPDDLQTLAIDHFGQEFARPQGSEATGVLTFSRPNASAGDVVIGVGTIVKTQPDSAGVSQRVQVTAAVTLTGTSINASAEALVVGTDGNVQANKLTLIETPLTDPTVTVNNGTAFSGGEDVETDAEYRETIRNLIETLRGATLAAIEAKAKTVAGVEQATGSEFRIPVKEWDIAGNAGTGAYFYITRTKLYIADANGVASQALLDAVAEAISLVRAAGVNVELFAATALTQNWTLALTLNPSGPNYATLQSNTTMIKDTMRSYIQNLPIGSDFIRADAEAHIMALWGPAGTDDLTDVNTTTPSGDVSTTATQKLIPGTMAN